MNCHEERPDGIPAGILPDNFVDNLPEPYNLIVRLTVHLPLQVVLALQTYDLGNRILNTMRVESA